MNDVTINRGSLKSFVTSFKDNLKPALLCKSVKISPLLCWRFEYMYITITLKSWHVSLALSYLLELYFMFLECLACFFFESDELLFYKFFFATKVKTDTIAIEYHLFKWSTKKKIRKKLFYEKFKNDR